MIYLTPKEIDELDEVRLRNFLQKKYRENRFLDYKLKYEKRTDEETKEEFLADVTAFANYYGGNIIIGVSELEEEGASSQPGELEGINDGIIWAERFRNLCETSIDPLISGLIIKEIPLKDGKWAIVVYIPPSLRKPHMVNFNRKREFYIKRDDRKGKMTSDEVKRTVLEVINLQNDMNSYIKMVETEITEDLIGDDFGLILHAVPFLLEEDQIDTSSENVKSILQSSDLKLKEFDISLIGAPMPTLHGIMGSDRRDKKYFYTYIHRTGYVGMTYNLQIGRDIKAKIFYSYFKSYIQAFFKLLTVVVERTKTSSPYQIRCILVNAKGSKFKYEDGISEYESESVWNRESLKLPAVRLDSFQNTDEIVELLFERFKNAFGME